ncbi:phosphotransferase [Streptomyces sp. NPDC042207]
MQLQVQQYEDNAVWRVTPPGGAPFVARLSVRDGRPAHQQRSEMRWLESLATSCTVAVPGHDGPSTLALLHWVPGIVELPYQEPGMAEQMGIATAQLHHNSATVEIADLDRPVWDAETILLKGHALNDPAAHQQMGTEGTAALWEVTERITPALQEGGDSDRGRIHGDLHRENMILMPGGGSVGVIDFDDCGTGH